MQEIRKRLRVTLELFFRVTTGILIVSLIFITLFVGIDVEMTVVPFLGQVLLTAALCVVFNFFVDYEKELSKKGLLAVMIGNYVYVNVVVLCCGVWFEWFSVSNWKMLVTMILGIATVFVAVVAFSWGRDYKTAQQMNERLNKR